MCAQLLASRLSHFTKPLLMRFVARVALVFLVIAVVSTFTALAWDRSERAAAQPDVRIGPN